MATNQTPDQQQQPKVHVFTRSSSISSARWDASGDMTITFKGGRSYVYENVPEAIFDGLVSASSAGQYFNSRIMDVYS
jgi:KTSC domain